MKIQPQRTQSTQRKNFFIGAGCGFVTGAAFLVSAFLAVKYSV